MLDLVDYQAVAMDVYDNNVDRLSKRRRLRRGRAICLVV